MDRVNLPKKKQPVKAIRQFCRECMGGGSIESTRNLIRDCAAPACPLYEFRFGKNPYHTLNLTDEQRDRRRNAFLKV